MTVDWIGGREFALGDVRRTAEFSECGKYRYLLTRDWLLEGPRLTWIALNPSTADASQDDPTVRRMMRFSHRWGWSGMRLVNLYALRSTDPYALWRAPDPVGPANDAWIEAVAGARDDQEVVCAWGALARQERVQQIYDLLWRARLKCLGLNANGSPRHPLYLCTTTKLNDLP